MSQSVLVPEELVNNALTFLGRVELKGAEVPAFNAVANFIQSLSGTMISPVETTVAPAENAQGNTTQPSKTEA